MNPLFNKNYTSTINTQVSVKNSDNNNKHIVREGKNTLMFVDNFNNIISLNIAQKKNASTFKTNKFLVKPNVPIKNYNFYILTKNSPQNYSTLNFIIDLKYTNNLIVLKPKKGRFFVYSSGLSGYITKSELKKILDILKKKSLEIPFFKKSFFSKYLILRLPTKLHHFTIIIYKKKLKLSKFLFIKTQNSQEYENQRNIKDSKKVYFKKTIKHTKIFHSKK